MKRVVKKSDERKQEIIEVAQRLFDEKGYNATSVADIIAALSISKGAFYHHFNSKKEVLLSLVDGIGEKMKQLYLRVMKAEEMTAIEKLRLMLRGQEKSEITNQSTMAVIHKPENRELQERLNIYAVNHLAPLLAVVIEQGNAEGVFQAERPLEIMRFMLASSLFVLDSGLFNWSVVERKNLLEAARVMLERSIGAKPGSFHL